MDLYIFCVVLGAAGMATMAFLGFATSHSGARLSHGNAHATPGHEAHGIGGVAHPLAAAAHAPAPPHAPVPPPTHSTQSMNGRQYNVTHYEVAVGHGEMSSSVRVLAHAGWKSHVWSWLSPRVLFNFLVGFGATGLILERLVGPLIALPIAIAGGA
ncbi:MAG TPA: hypothetical protein VE110_03735, partial [Gemmatimonadaceae bacterium]|nr:hypothetical protein [Gemmatimonadaceae bacterium]